MVSFDTDIFGTGAGGAIFGDGGFVIFGTSSVITVVRVDALRTRVCVGADIFATVVVAEFNFAVGGVGAFTFGFATLG